MRKDGEGYKDEEAREERWSEGGRTGEGDEMIE